MKKLLCKMFGHKPDKTVDIYFVWSKIVCKRCKKVLSIKEKRLLLLRSFN